MESLHLAALEVRLGPENWSGTVEFETALDGGVKNGGVTRYQGLNQHHLEAITQEPVDEETLHLKVQTVQSELRIAQSARTRAFLNESPLQPERRVVQEPGFVAHRFSVDLSEGDEVRLEKVMSLYTSRDPAISECGLESGKSAKSAGGFDDLLDRHALAWRHLWRRFDIHFERTDDPDDHPTAMVLRLNIFHLLQTASPHTVGLDVGIPSRGWHGEAYRGHVFWDELFIFPFLNLRVPEITRSLLLYRYRRLGAAREAAAEAGFRGALYPWQSGSNGREESQRLHLNPKSGRWIPDNSHLQRHVNAAIAYNICQYYEVTEDMELLCSYGAEMLLEIARCWADQAVYNPTLERYEINGVMGPDEYHDAYPGAQEAGLNNNAYTNVMAAWVLIKALDVLKSLPGDRSGELCEKLDLHMKELDRWEDISRKMRVVFHDDGIISQFEGYDVLEEFDWEGYQEKYGDIQRLDRILEAEDDTPNRYKASKQADVLMLFYLFSSEELGALFRRLGYTFDKDLIPRNIRYYNQRTSHGSTLSRVVHGSILGRSNRCESWPLFEEALESDYRDIQGGTTPEGIHLGAMAGSVNIVQQTYTGIELREDALWFNPRLPDEMERLSMNVRYRGQALHVTITRNELTIQAAACSREAIRIGVNEGVSELKENETRTWTLKEASQGT